MICACVYDIYMCVCVVCVCGMDVYACVCIMFMCVHMYVCKHAGMNACVCGMCVCMCEMCIGKCGCA